MKFIDGTEEVIRQSDVENVNGSPGEIGVLPSSKVKCFAWNQKKLRFAGGYSMGESLREYLESEGVEKVYIKDEDTMVDLSDVNTRLDPWDSRFNERPPEPQYVIQL